MEEYYPVVKYPDGVKRAEINEVSIAPQMPIKQEGSIAGLTACVFTAIISFICLMSQSMMGFAVFANVSALCSIWLILERKANARKASEYELSLKRYKEDLAEHEEDIKRYKQRKLPKNEIYNFPVYNTRELLNALSMSSSPSVPCTGKKGIVEEKFLQYLLNWFPGCISINQTAEYYVPDYVYRHKETGLTIDIEIDEPYVAKNNKPIHYIGADDKRDSNFLVNGWLVVRFSEEQAYFNPNFSCLYLFRLIESLIGDVHDIRSKLEDKSHFDLALNKRKRWTREEAISLAERKYRQGYLKIDFVQSFEEEEDSLPF